MKKTSIALLLGTTMLLGQSSPVHAIEDPGTTQETTTQINLRDTAYGAVGDGLADDTEAIQKAINDAAAQNVPLYIPDGIYLISKAITLPIQLTITGTGTLKKSDDFTQGTVNPAGMMLDGRYSKITKLHISGITIDGNEVNQPTYAESGMYSTGIVVYHASNLHIERVKFTNTGYRAVDVRWSDNITFHNNVFEDCGVNIAGKGLQQEGTNANDTNGGNALSYDASTNIQVTNNLFDRWGDAATDGEEATDVLIDSNTFKGMPYYGWTSHPEESAISMSGESRVTVTNNTVYSLRGITGFIPTNSINGTEKIALRDITIKNNQITGAALAGIDLWGLHADLPSSKILIENNTIDMKGGTTTDRYTGVQSTLKQATGAITFHHYMDNIDLIGNTIDAKGHEFATGDLPGVMFHGASNDKIIRMHDLYIYKNTIKNARGAGVYVRNAEMVRLTENNTYNNGLAYTGQTYRGDLYLLRVNNATVTNNVLRPDKAHLAVGIYYNLSPGWAQSGNTAYHLDTAELLNYQYLENTVEPTN